MKIFLYLCTEIKNVVQMIGFNLPIWVHVIILIVAVVISGFICVDKDNKVDPENVGLCAVGTVTIVFFWQFILGIAVVLGILYIPFYVGMSIKKTYTSYKEKKEKSLDEIFPKQEDNNKTIEKYKKI